MDGHLLVSQGWNLWPVFDRLTFYDEKLKPQPMLAESFEPSSDMKQIKLNLRKGVQFHSGREFTAEDVKYNLTRVRDPKVGAVQLANMSAWFTTVDTPDKYTVILKAEQARPAMFDFLEYFNIQDREVLEGPNAKSKAGGTGPFAFGEWVQGDHLRLVKNKNYWQSGRPYLDEIVIHILKDPQAQVAQLEGGGLDMADKPPVRDAARYQKDRNYHLVLSEFTGSYFCLTLNTTVAPTNNKTFRQALSYAVDRKRFADTILLGLGHPESLPWPKFSPAYEADKNSAQSFDLNKAKSLLAQSGVTSAEIEGIYQVGGDAAELNPLAQMYQADLAKIGIKMTIKPLDPPTWMDVANKRQYKGVDITGSAFANVEPSSLFLLSHFWIPNGNGEGFESDRYSKLVQQAGSEPDPSKRKQLYSQLNDLILDEAFVVALASHPLNVATTTKVHGLRYTMHEGLNYTDTWMG